MHRKFSLFFLFFTLFFWAQSKPSYASLEVVFQFKNKKVEKGNPCITSKGDTLTFEKLKFYIAEIEFIDANENSITLVEYPQLIDWDQPETLKIDFTTVPMQEGQLQFTLGVPYDYNVNGVFDGDLDPIHGMYWAWQSGFIFIKIEGASKAIQTFKHKFQYHLGGYNGATNALTTVNIPLHSNSKQLIIDLDAFFESMEYKQINTIMSPSAQAVQLANLFKTTFRIQ